MIQSLRIWKIKGKTNKINMDQTMAPHRPTKHQLRYYNLLKEFKPPKLQPHGITHCSPRCTHHLSKENKFFRPQRLIPLKGANIEQTPQPPTPQAAPYLWERSNQTFLLPLKILSTRETIPPHYYKV